MIESLVIFRRDLRLDDQFAVLHAIRQTQSGNTILPIFIFDSQQISNENKYRSAPAILFMVQSLIDLNNQIKEHQSRLRFFFGNPTQQIEKIIKEIPSIHKVFINYDVTPFAKQRDQEILDLCSKHNIELHGNWNELLFPPHTILTTSQTYYQKFTPYYINASKREIPMPQKAPNKIPFEKSTTKISFEIPESKINDFVPELPKDFQLLHPGGRSHILERWTNIKSLKDYEETRDIPSIKTTEWSAALKFGCISVREALHHLKKTVKLTNGIARQLYFREFYFQVMNENPQLLQTNKNQTFLTKWNNYPYTNKPEFIHAWKSAMTGFPIVDAGIRQMLHTGFMHNRVRMLAASLLNKDMDTDWRIGEEFFAQKLYDYDPSQNNAGWQSTCGMGASALDWNRVMNPWIQTEKFDPDAIYIKTWIPELKDVPTKDIINWKDEYKKYTKTNYPGPIVEHKERAQKYLEKTKKFL